MDSTAMIDQSVVGVLSAESWLRNGLRHREDCILIGPGKFPWLQKAVELQRAKVSKDEGTFKLDVALRELVAQSKLLCRLKEAEVSVWDLSEKKHFSKLVLCKQACAAAATPHVPPRSPYLAPPRAQFSMVALLDNDGAHSPLLKGLFVPLAKVRRSFLGLSFALCTPPPCNSLPPHRS